MASDAQKRRVRDRVAVRLGGERWEHVAWVDSETTAGETYQIKRRASDGALGCGCESYRWSRGDKTCKHIEALRRADEDDVVVAQAARAADRPATLRDEALVLARTMCVEIVSRVPAAAERQMRDYVERKLLWFVDEKVPQYAAAPQPQRAAAVSVRVRAETFRVRRAMALGGPSRVAP